MRCFIFYLTLIVLTFPSNVVFLSNAACIDMPTFNSLYIADFNEKYDVDHDGFLNLVSAIRNLGML